ncbi:MAG: hypothetical protein KIT34_14000 [Cyanobacteria bacterium TGS_CYA1]|nr:hypothetical protein [Cyanobacteria bacterium TGS_CYA1]
MQLKSSHRSKTRCARVILSLQLIFTTAAPAFAWQESTLTQPTSLATSTASVTDGEAKAVTESNAAVESNAVVESKEAVETKAAGETPVETSVQTQAPSQVEAKTETTAEAKVETLSAPPQEKVSESKTTETSIAESETKTTEAQATETQAPQLAEKTDAKPEEPSNNGDISSLKIPQHENSLTPLLTPEKNEADLSFLEDGAKEDEEGIITIDSDESEEVQSTIVYEELPTDEGKTHIKAGAQFPVAMVSQLSSKTAKLGDNIQARLKYDIKIGDRHIAKKGSVVTGHIDYCLPARSVMHSLVSPTRWYRNSGCIGIAFDEILNEKGEHIALNAKPARRARIVKNKAEGRLLGVNHDGQITGPWGQQLRYKAVRVGLNAAMAPAGAFTFGAMPVALGVMGAINPSFAFMKPVGTNVRHRRLKGFAWGFLSGIPGSWIIEDTVTKGQEAIIKPGDEFLVELQKEFTGEAMTEAELMPGATSKVRGEVDRKGKSKK